MATEGAFDHAAISVRDRMDEAVAAFGRLGFAPTPRGHHTLGSINHLIVLGTTYVELIGVPPDQPDVRPELRDAPIGLNGLVFRSANAHATHARVEARGAPVLPVQSFSRPVLLEDGTLDARFRTVRTVPGASPAGRVYFCEHLTPELVWRAPWQSHANGALELTGARVRVRDLDAEAALYRSLLGDDAVRRSPRGVQVRAAPVTIEIERSDDAPAMTGLAMRVADLARAERLLRDAGVAFARDGDGLAVDPSEAFQVSLRLHP